MNKQAVDSNAAEYWTQYFSSGYGKMWVRQLPKRIKAALSAEMTIQSRRAAQATSNGAITPTLRIIEGSAAPLAHAVTDEGVILEGVFRGLVENPSSPGRPERIARVFRAAFDHEGKLTAFRSVSAP